MTVAPSRRERMRATTIKEIKQTARTHLLKHGADGISHRAIARDVGMSPPGLARYFPSRDALLTAITADAYNDLTAYVGQARDSVPEPDVIGRFAAAARALRRWALTNPAEFQLTFGKPPRPRAERLLLDDPDGAGSNDITRRTHQDCDDAGLNFGAVFTQMVAQLWSQGGFPIPDRETIAAPLWDELGPLADDINARLSPDRQLPAEAVLVFLSGWTMLYGLVAVEAFGHQRWALSDPEPLFERGLAEILRTLQPA